MDNLNNKLSDETQSQPSCLGAVMPSLYAEKLKQIRRIADDVYHDLVSSNNPSHDEWCSSPKNLKILMAIVDKLLGNEA
jgi:hypothetical protein